MRKAYKIIIAVISLSSTIGYSQTSISTVPPKLGDSSVVATVTYTADQTADPGTAGTGKNWDFSSILPGNDITVNKYVLPSTLTGSTNFPTATLGIESISLITGSSGSASFINTTANGVNVVGINVEYGSSNIVIKYSDPLLQDFPNLAYNGTFSDPFAGTQVLEPNTLLYNITGNVIYKYDANGSFKYTFGSFNNVARINYTTKMVYNGAGIYSSSKVESSSQNYAYFDLNSKQMLMAIVISTTTTYNNNVQSNKSTIKRVLLYKPSGVTGLNDELSLNGQLMLYPNPANEIINVNNVFEYITIKDNNGITLMEKDLHLSSLVNISTLNNGIYLAELITSRNEKKCVKLVVNK